MSDPVTNVEIEDVLSSIRRLVSTEPSSKHGDKAEQDGGECGGEIHAETQKETRAAPPKLVLTPAQRVKDHAPAMIEETQELAPEEDVFEADAALDIAGTGESAGVGDIAEASEPVEDAGQDSLLQMVADQVTAEVANEAWEEVDAQLAEPSEEDQPIDDAIVDDAVDAGERATLDFNDIEDAEVISADDVTADEHDLYRMTDDDMPEFLRRPLAQVDPSEAVEPISDSSEDTEEINSEVETLTSKLETLEQAVAEQVDDWEPDGGDAETLTPDELEPLPWKEVESEIEDVSREEAAGDPSPEAEEAQAPPRFGEDAVLDENALRDMVGEIVRQELQGALGERITRNVRKLVRREINRALMSQGLD
ncbi:MAG: hypothetical protein AAF280_05615 [Pseudomonadota bacterium]